MHVLLLTKDAYFLLTYTLEYGLTGNSRQILTLNNGRKVSVKYRLRQFANMKGL